MKHKKFTDSIFLSQIKVSMVILNDNSDSLIPIIKSYINCSNTSIDIRDKLLSTSLSFITKVDVYHPKNGIWEPFIEEIG